MLCKNERYKVSTADGAVAVYVLATSVFDALERVRNLTEEEKFKIVERIDEYDSTLTSFVHCCGAVDVFDT